MRRSVVLGLFLAVVLGAGRAAAAEPAKEAPKAAAKDATKDKEKAAVTAATAWLALVDQAKYADSWKEAAELFKAAIKAEGWAQAAEGVRKPLGQLVSRKVKTTTYQTSAPGAPDGEYVIIQFDTVFEKKKEAVETVTPMLDKDGKWHVSGYFIK
jgi:hypothetical protein